MATILGPTTLKTMTFSITTIRIAITRTTQHNIIGITIKKCDIPHNIMLSEIYTKVSSEGLLCVLMLSVVMLLVIALPIS